MLKKITDPFILSFLILVILGGTLAYLKIGPRLKEKQNKPWLADKIESVDKIRIKNSQQEAILIKKNNKWLVASENDSATDPEKIKDLLGALGKLNKKELVSENEDNQQKLGVDQENGIKLKVYQNNQLLLDLLVGYAGPDFEKAYIRFPNEKKVYLSNVPLRSVLIQPRWAKEVKEAAEDSS